ncbi:MAG: S1C family serine protease [Rhizobiaceae bacterium]
MSLLSDLSKDVADLAETASAAVASIFVPRRWPASAVHWRDGLYVTAEEAIDGDEEVGILLPSKERLSGELVGRDASTGLALIRAGKEPAATLKSAAPVRAGSLAVAVGRSEEDVLAGFGTVSEAGPAWRSMRGGRIDRRIRLGMALDGRFEGGAALDAEGGLIGIVLFGPRRRPLVIPAETMERTATALAEKGFVPRGYLGAGLHPLRNHGQTGAIVMSIDEEGPCKAAGLLVGDIVTAWNGEEIAGVRDLLRRLGPDSVGTTVTLGIVRAGEAASVDVAIAARPSR